MIDTILGIDIGTQAAKAVLFDLSGTELFAVERGYRLSTPQAGWAEQDPEAVWQALLAILKSVTEQAGPERRICALALAAQSGSLIPADAAGRPVYPMITWLDSRTEGLVQQWRAEGVEETVRELSGWQLHPGLPLPNIVWLRQNRPETFAQAERFLGVLDFCQHRLTGQFCADLSSAAEMQLVDIETGQWHKRLCDLAGVSPDQLSQLQPAGTVVGTVTAAVSRETGLPPDTPVINGGHDQCCTSLAMGMLEPGKIMLATGTAWVITGVVQSPAVAAIPATMDLNFHVVPQRWTISQLLGGFGATMEWFIEQSWQAPDSASALPLLSLYRLFDAALAQSEPGSHDLLFLPLGGSNQAATDQGGFIGLRLDHTRIDMSRAILEGAAFELRWALESVRQAGLPVEQLWLSGGAGRSPVWPQILADISGVPLALTDYTHWPALGAAILAGVGVGLFDSLAAGVERLQRPIRQIRPDEKLAPLYAERFAAYQHAARRVGIQ